MSFSLALNFDVARPSYARTVNTDVLYVQNQLIMSNARLPAGIHYESLIACVIPTYTDPVYTTYTRI